MSIDREPVSVTSEQIDAVADFLKYLFEDSVESYWDSISKVDQARAYGMYIGQIEIEVLPEDYDFYEYVREVYMFPQRELYEDIKENYGYAQYIRYSDDGEPVILMRANAPETKVHEEPIQVEITPITLSLDTEFNRENIESLWKVRLYSDKFYNAL